MSNEAPIGLHGQQLPVAMDAIQAIRYPQNGKLRARKVVSRSKTRSSGKYPSWKMKRMLQWESPHELNAFRLLDANPAVGRFEEQPLVVNYVLDGIQHDHYPDVRVMVDGAQELWEVKTRADALDPETTRRTKLMTKGLPTFGYRYRMVIAEDLASAPRLTNALTLLQSGRADISIVERERLRRLLAQIQQVTWGDILDGALGARSKASACRLMLEGALRFDMGTRLKESTVIVVTNSGACRRSALA